MLKLCDLVNKRCVLGDYYMCHLSSMCIKKKLISFTKDIKQNRYPSNLVKEVNDMLRSVQKALDIIKTEDPETAVTLHTIRLWCKEGKVRYIYAGTKILVDVESLKQFINTANT